jgi:hypothetical protein
MPYIRMAALMLAMSTLAAAGCGGSKSNSSSSASSTQTGASNAAASKSSTGTKTLTRAELIAQGDAICRRLTLQLRSPALDDNSLHTVGTTSVPEVALYRTAYNELSALTPPSTMTREWKVFVADMSKFPRELKTMGQFALAKNLNATNNVETEIGEVQRHRFAIARRNGLIECAE